ncbi:NAD-dependent epimerase/dehydratase family protein [Shewanella sp. LZH-2]|uniref:NAD-dependent epimerase/dehydratase family protein n=1 Tax=Shewanella sp. LZH-2 TaxID=2806008 RepID=UPI001EF08AD0|nr:NAD-dependent epimerase/dehydratase family protein [Shewanella sp. LZH-2]
MVTGATGFVGRHLCSLIEGCLPVARKNPFSGFSSIIVPEFNESVCWGSLIKVDVSCVIHLAGVAHKASSSCNELYSVNTEATLHLAREIAKIGVKRFIFVSSIGVNGASTHSQPFDINSASNPHNVYAQSKHDAEIGLKKIAAETGLEVVIIRPTLVYGPNAPGNFGILTKFVKRSSVLPFGLVNNKRDFIAVQNLVDLLITCVNHPNAAGHTFLASDMETVSIKQFTSAIADGLGKKVFQLPIPVSLMRFGGKLMGKSAMVEQLVGNLQVDSSNIKEVLGWTPPLTMKQAMATLRDSGKSSSGKELI